MATNFNLRLDEQLKAQSFSVIKDFGLTPSQFMRLILKQVADTGSLPLSFEKRPQQAIIPNTETAEAIRQGRADYLAGKLVGYDADDAVQALQDIAHG